MVGPVNARSKSLKTGSRRLTALARQPGNGRMNSRQKTKPPKDMIHLYAYRLTLYCSRAHLESIRGHTRNISNSRSIGHWISIGELARPRTQIENRRHLEPLAGHPSVDHGLPVLDHLAHLEPPAPHKESGCYIEQMANLRNQTFVTAICTTKEEQKQRVWFQRRSRGDVSSSAGWDPTHALYALLSPS